MRSDIARRCCFVLGAVVVVPSSPRITVALANAFVGRSLLPRRSHLVRYASDDTNDSINSDSINGGAKQTKKKPSTGWNHNQPSASSKFWKTVEGGNGNDESTPTDASQPKKQLRTGWLHNTESKTTSTSVRGGATNTPNKSATTNNLARRRLDMARWQQTRNHRIVAPPTLHAGGDGDTVVAVTEHVLSVPLDYNDSTSQRRIDVYWSIVEPIQSAAHRNLFETGLGVDCTPRQRADAYVNYHRTTTSLDDTLLYLQGGPGFGAPTPVTGLGIAKGCGSWADAALYQCQYRRIVLMDQRGTGRSTPITKQTLELQFPGLLQKDDDDCDDKAVEAATEYMTHFRADNIVRDAESIREALLYEDIEAEDDEEKEPVPWGCSLGQSYGGFCSMTYLSLMDHPPKRMLLTGGIGPMLASHAVDVYRRLWDRVKTRNCLYYAMYPGDVAAVKRIVRTLLARDVRLPSGGHLTPRRFLLVGIALGSSPSSFASLHELVSNVFVDATVENDEDLVFSRAFLKRMVSLASFDEHPIYYWMHESIYADGPPTAPTQWAAERALADKIKTDPAFDFTTTCRDDNTENPVLFYGEHVFSWMSEDFAELSGPGFRALAQALADKKDWGPLYDATHMRQMLQDGHRTRAAAAVYYQDMFVDFDACMQVTAPGGPLEHCKVYVTNEYQHSGLRDNGAALFVKLHGMATGGTRIPS